MCERERERERSGCMPVFGVWAALSASSELNFFSTFVRDFGEQAVRSFVRSFGRSVDRSTLVHNSISSKMN